MNVRRSLWSRRIGSRDNGRRTADGGVEVFCSDCRSVGDLAGQHGFNTRGCLPPRLDPGGEVLGIRGILREAVLSVWVIGASRKSRQQTLRNARMTIQSGNYYALNTR